ncbi:MAG: hypothetical protein IMZ62_11465 [Chloroflexi bacterium]|nr:hypothetical protein [Chloroflexota bacterium]
MVVVALLALTAILSLAGCGEERRERSHGDRDRPSERYERRDGDRQDDRGGNPDRERGDR